ncbi:MAG TPA: hypothetical protein VIU93_00715 [Gallionellaceae bacterium]
MKSVLEIKSIWEDADLFEVRVFASNGRFSGTADCYTQRDEMANLAKLIEGFPRTLDQKVNFTTGESDTFSYFSINLSCVDGSGHVRARIKVANNVTYSNAPAECDLAEFDMNLEPVAIDNFSATLKILAAAELKQARAILEGKV